MALGTLAIAAAATATWFAREHPVKRFAKAQPESTPKPVATEGSVGIGLTARVTSGSASAPTAPPTASTPPPPPTGALAATPVVETKAPDTDKSGAAAKLPHHVASAKPEAKPEKPAQPEHAERAPAQSASPSAGAGASTEAPKSPPASPATTPAARAANVDALLQQQLKGAIP
jgi:hypothetical protein